MSNIKTFVPPLALLLGAFASPGTAAEVVLDHSAGVSQPSASGYDEDLFANASVGYRHADWQFRLGYMYLGEFELEGTGRPERSSITMRGPHLAVVREFDSQVMQWELGLGVGHIATEAKLYGRRLDKRHETAPYLELAAVKEFNDLFALKGGVTYFNDVAGSDITALSVGFRFSF